jgi:ABC-2 type transport system permease protein
MWTVFKHSLTKYRGAIIGWGLTLALLGALIIRIYDSVAVNVETWNQLIAAYPKEIMGFFGNASFTTPGGFLSLEYFSYIPLVLGVFAVLAGSGMLAADEERGVLDLEVAQPVSRSSLFWGRAASMVLTLMLVVAIGYATMIATMSLTQLDLNDANLSIPFVSLLAQLSLFAGLALLLSMLLPSRQSAAMLAGILLVASFFANGLANLNEAVANVNKFLPLAYYQGSNWVDGLKLNWLLGVIAVDSVFTLTAWQLFLRRDIRVGGEGGWKLPRLSAILRNRSLKKTQQLSEP